MPCRHQDLTLLAMSKIIPWFVWGNFETAVGFEPHPRGFVAFDPSPREERLSAPLYDVIVAISDAKAA